MADDIGAFRAEYQPVPRRGQQCNASSDCQLCPRRLHRDRDDEAVPLMAHGGSTLTESIDAASSRPALAQRHRLTDLGLVPKRIRALANFWGGSSTGGRAMYELAQRNGLIRSIGELRSEISRLQDPKARNELLTWLASRTR